MEEERANMEFENECIRNVKQGQPQFKSTPQATPVKFKHEGNRNENVKQEDGEIGDDDDMTETLQQLKKQVCHVMIKPNCNVGVCNSFKYIIQ